MALWQRTIDWYAFAGKLHFLNTWFLTILGLVATLIFDLLTLKSNQIIFVPNCSLVINLVKFPQAVCTIPCAQISIRSCTDARKHAWTVQNRMPTACNVMSSKRNWRQSKYPSLVSEYTEFTELYNEVLQLHIVVNERTVHNKHTAVSARRQCSWLSTLDTSRD